MGYNAQFQVWRGDDTDGELEDFTVEVNEGEVVLDIIHRLQATQTPGPRGPVELQGRQVRLVQRRDQRPAAAAVHDPHEHVRRGRGRHRDAAARLPRRQGPRHRRLLQLREGARGAGLRAAGATWRRASTGCTSSTWSAARSSASASSASSARTPATSSVTTRRTSRPSPAPASSSGSPSWTCTRSTAKDRKRQAQDDARPRHVQHHQVLHRGVPRAHQDHRQRDHPDEGARGRHEVRPAGLARQQDPAPVDRRGQPHALLRRHRQGRGAGTRPAAHQAVGPARADDPAAVAARPGPLRRGRRGHPDPGRARRAQRHRPAGRAGRARLGAALRRRGRPARARPRSRTRSRPRS